MVVGKAVYLDVEVLKTVAEWVVLKDENLAVWMGAK
jgi:hypothetical protein